MPTPLQTRPAQADLVLIALNPNAGAKCGRARVEALEAFLVERGYRVEVLSDVEEIAARAAETFREGVLRALVAAGGDGTAALWVNRTDAGVPIAVLPLGTENLLSKYLGVRTSPEFVGEMIDAGVTAQFDAGRANGHLFLLMVGVGFDAEVVHQVHQNRTGHIHHLSYAKPIFSVVRNYQYPELRVYCESEHGGEASSTADSERAEISARWAFVANLPRYAGGLGIVPDADGTDGLLNVCTFKRGGFWRGMGILTNILLRRHRSSKDCTTLRSRKIRIEANEGEEVHYQLDGDPGGTLPVDIEIVPNRMTLIVPKTWVEKQGWEVPS